MKRLKSVFSGTSAAVLSLSSILTMGFTGVASAAAQTCTWTGAGTDSKFSTVANWSNCGGGAPQEGDIIRFDKMQPTTKALVNDLTIHFGGLVSVASAVATNRAGFTVDKLSFADGAKVSVEQDSTCRFDYPQIVPTEVNGVGSMSIVDNIFGWNPYKLVVAGKLTITSVYGTAVSSFAAGSSADTVTIASPIGWALFTTATDCGGGSGSSSGGAATNDLANMTYKSVTIENGASMILANYSGPMTLGGGTGTESPTIYFRPDTDPNTYDALSSSRQWSSTVTLLSNASVDVGDKTAVTFTGTLSGAGKTLTKTAASTGTFTNSATTNTSATPAGAQTNPAKSTTLEGNTTDPVIVVPNETAVLTGQRDFITVLSGGILKGTGTVTKALTVNEGAKVAPGNSPGCIVADTMSLHGEYQFELAGTDPCTGYDQLKVTNATATYPTLNLAMNGASTATIATARLNGYTPKQGQAFTIIDVAGTQAVNGTFKDLPEGATFTQNGVVFKISYKGGDGNDVVLTVQNQPTAPDTGFALVSANPLVTLGATAGAAAVLVAMARKTRPAHARVHASRRRK